MSVVIFDELMYSFYIFTFWAINFLYVAGWLAGWLVNLPTGWLDSRLASWLAGRVSSWGTGWTLSFSFLELEAKP